MLSTLTGNSFESFSTVTLSKQEGGEGRGGEGGGGHKVSPNPICNFNSISPVAMKSGRYTTSSTFKSFSFGVFNWAIMSQDLGIDLAQPPSWIRQLGQK